MIARRGRAYVPASLILAEGDEVMRDVEIGLGLGLREPHYNEVLENRPKEVEWFEIISENFMDMHGGYLAMLQDIRRDYPLVMHGVALSIGSTDPLDKKYLKKLYSLAEVIKPAMISDHLCFTGVEGVNTHDLLPIPLTEEALNHVRDRVVEVQNILGRQICLENPSSYLEFEASTIPEWEFVARLAEEAGCGILLDVNNVYVSSVNHGFDPREYIDVIPESRIGYVHLAGHSQKPGYLFDTHDHPVPDAVWDLYEYALLTKGTLNTMIEWDSNIPAFSELLLNLQKIREIQNQRAGAGALKRVGEAP